jgi:hypothetical protein
VRPGYPRGGEAPRDPGSRVPRSRDRFFGSGSHAGSYGYPDLGGRTRRRSDVNDYYDPFVYAAPYYAAPFYSPFSPYGWGYDPYSGVFGYSDWYTEGRYQTPPQPEQAPRSDEEEWPEQSRGNVVLHFEPRDVEVRINDIVTTHDGWAVLNLPTGTYRVEVSRKGYRTWATELVVRQGIRYRLEQRLERLRPGDEDLQADASPPPTLVGALALDVQPEEAIATLDGRLLGVVSLLRSGAALQTIPVGRHKLERGTPATGA